MYIDDCVNGTIEVLAGDNVEPVNLGSAELVTINQMVDILEEIAGVTVQRSYNMDAPQGVRGRNSDNTLFRQIYGWEPSISLKEGLGQTYTWIHDQLASRR
jgi:nucleoside-diphosphate-sugar epimerase